MTREQISTLLDRHFEAVMQHDVDGLMSYYADACLLESPLGGSGKGRDAITHVYQTWFSTSADLDWQLDARLIDQEGEDRAIEVAVVHGTDTGGFMGYGATGRKFRFAVMMFYTFDGDRIVKFRTLYDFTGVLVQLGVLKAKPGKPA